MVKREVLFKWTAYALCIVALMFLRMLTLGALTFWDALPFLPPILLVCVASQEEMRSAAIFGLVFGIFCDLTLSAPFPCLYTLAFMPSALLIAYFSSTVSQNPFLRALFGTVLTFALTDLFCMLSLAFSCGTAFLPMLSLAAREAAVSLPFLAVYPFFALIHRFFAF